MVQVLDEVIITTELILVVDYCAYPPTNHTMG
jgi:hypothetical protein